MANDRPGDRMARGAEVAFAAAVIGILFVILVPLPTALVDALLIVNITGSLMVLMTASSVARPLDFNIFPSLLLVVTFFRLALNVATTRLILGNAHQDKVWAAGGVIRAFADFVAGSSVVVGLIVFSILVVVQFVVITRGTTRISEVAARFTLDALPGKQLAIDGELSTGIISEKEARRRRADLSREADFFGAMDGASKFVRGEAVASLIVTLTNIAGGFVLGILYHGMGVADAANVFARLTIGDGLVTQIPALMVSVGTALLITKSSASEGLGQDIGRQLLGNPRVFWVAAAFLLFLLPSGLPKAGLIVGALACATAASFVGGKRRAEEPEAETVGEGPSQPPQPPAESPQERVRSLLAFEPIELEIGYQLVGLVEGDGDLMARLSRVRERVALDLGLVVPPVKVRDNTRLHPGEYRVNLRGNAVGRWKVHPRRVLVLTEGETPAALEGIPGTDPATGEAGLWITDSELPAAASAGFPTRTAAEIMADHLDRITRRHAAEILTREEVSRLISDLRQRAPSLVEEVIPGLLRMGDLHKVLQTLLREQVSIRNLETILEALADGGERTRDPAELTEQARRALARTICGPLATRDGALYAALLDPALEEFLQTSVERTERGTRLAIEPEVAQTLTSSMAHVLSGMEEARRPPVLVCSGLIRAHLRNLVMRELPQAAVLAYEEVAEDFRLEVHGSVALEKVC